MLKPRYNYETVWLKNGNITPAFTKKVIVYLKVIMSVCIISPLSKYMKTVVSANVYVVLNCPTLFAFYGRNLKKPLGNGLCIVE